MSRTVSALLLVATLVGTTPRLAHADQIAGLWEGTYHRPRGDQAVAVVLRPRGTASFEGMVFFDGGEFGPIEEGIVRGDSVMFRATNYPFAGMISGSSLALTLFVPHGTSHPFTLSHTSADTTRLPESVRNAPLPDARPAIIRDVVPESIYVAHAVPADAPAQGAPCLRHGTLILVGGGPTQADHQARFLTLAGGSTANIVAIPTAHVESTDPAELADYGANMARNFGVPHVHVLHTFSRKEADSEEFVKPLRTATGVWIDGGEGTYLLNAYMGTRTERELVALLNRGGVIAGTSAGALIWGSRSMVFRAHPGAKTYEMAKVEDLLVGQAHEPCLGVLRNVLVAPHFTEFRLKPALDEMIAAYPKLVAFGIDEATAVEVHDDTCTVLGRSTVAVYRGNDGKPLFTLKDGARFDLRRLAPL